MIVIKIDVKKIDKALLYTGAKGTYLDAALHEKPNDYGDAGFVTQSVSKDKREQGIKGPIIGNWRHVGSKPSADPNYAKPLPPAAATTGDDDLPF